MTTTTKIATNRADAIASFIYGAAVSALDAKGVAAEAAEALKEAGQEAGNQRESLMQRIARESSMHFWSEREVSDAIGLVGQKFNNKQRAKSFATMASELKMAAHPDVAPHFDTLSQLRALAWDAEADAAKVAKAAEMSADTPCKRAFSRSYHMLVAMLRRITGAKNGQVINPFTTVESVVEFARMNDPRLDPKKIERQLEALRDNLREFYGSYPVEDVKDLLDYAEKCLSGESLAAQVKAINEQRDQEARDAEEAAAREAAEAENLERSTEDATGEEESNSDADPTDVLLAA